MFYGNINILFIKFFCYYSLCGIIKGKIGQNKLKDEVIR